MPEPSSSDHPACLYLVLTCPEGGATVYGRSRETLQLTNMQEGPPGHYMVSWTQKLPYPRREEFYHVGSGSCLIWEFPSVSFISIKKNKREPINCTMNADLLDYIHLLIPNYSLQLDRILKMVATRDSSPAVKF